jgi:hypothetical protein
MLAFKFKRIFCLSMLLCLSSCASYHNLNTDGANHLGGGFMDVKLAPKLFSLTVKTNFAPWKNFSSAWKTWNKRAGELCNGAKFENIEVQESHYNTVAGEGYVISQVKGFVLCANSDLERSEIDRLIKGV